MGVRERTQSKRKPERKMKIPLVLLVACVASLKAASLMDGVFDGQCPPECCPTEAPTTEPATTEPPTTEPATTDPAQEERDATTTVEIATTEEVTTTADPVTTDPVTTDPVGPTTTADICSSCDQS